MSLCANTKHCQACRPRNLFQKCSGCQSAYYCDAKCQKQGWVGGHKKECAALAAKRERKVAKAKRKAQKLGDAKKKAEKNHESFSMSMSLILMSDSESDGESDDSDSSMDDLTLSHTSLGNHSKNSLNGSKNSFNKSLLSIHKDEEEIDREVALLEQSFSHFALEK